MSWTHGYVMTHEQLYYVHIRHNNSVDYNKSVYKVVEAVINKCVTNCDIYKYNRQNKALTKIGITIEQCL